MPKASTDKGHSFPHFNLILIQFPPVVSIYLTFANSLLPLSLLRLANKFALDSFINQVFSAYHVLDTVPDTVQLKNNYLNMDCIKYQRTREFISLQFLF